MHLYEDIHRSVAIKLATMRQKLAEDSVIPDDFGKLPYAGADTTTIPNPELIQKGQSGGGGSPVRVSPMSMALRGLLSGQLPPDVSEVINSRPALPAIESAVHGNPGTKTTTGPIGMVTNTEESYNRAFLGLIDKANKQVDPKSGGSVFNKGDRAMTQTKLLSRILNDDSSRAAQIRNKAIDASSGPPLPSYIPKDTQDEYRALYRKYNGKMPAGLRQQYDELFQQRNPLDDFKALGVQLGDYPRLPGSPF